MKNKLLGIVAMVIWLLAFGAASAQTLPEYTDCTQWSNWWFTCQEYQSCNNSDWFCICTINSLLIPHNTTCLRNNTLIKNRVVSSFGVSGSIVTFKFTVQNNSTAKYFELRLPPSYLNPKIKVLQASNDWLMNGWFIVLQNWLANPVYHINANETKNIIVTWQIISNTAFFDRIETSACVRSTISNVCLEQPVAYIFSIANYSITQSILNPNPVFVNQEAIYEIKVTNNSSKSSAESITLTSDLGNFLWTPSLTNQWTAITNNQSSENRYYWNLGVFSPGETKTYRMTSPLTSNPPAWSIITTTWRIDTIWRELQLSDNIVSTSFSIPNVVDVFLDRVQKTSNEPESNTDLLWFSITYWNSWNQIATGVYITATISWTNQINTVLNLPDINPWTENIAYITWLIDQNYPVWTRFCFSWNIRASNETQNLNNNSISEICYIMQKSADIEIQASLTNQLESINNWSILNYNIRLRNLWEKTANNVTINLYPSANQTSQTPIVFSGITIAWGETRNFTYSAVLNSYPIQWTSFGLSGLASFAGIDLDPTNNNFILNYNLSGLADVYISHVMAPFTWYRIGDTITYTINYGNSWYEAAINPTITFTLPAGIQANQTTWNLGNLLAAWDVWTIVVTWTLTQNLTAGSTFASTARISTTSAQATTANDISTITWTVSSYNDIAINAYAQNTTRPNLTIDPTTLIRAVSWDIISFTITYANNWNVPIQNMNVLFTNLWPITLDPYNWNIGTIWPNQQGTLVVNGRIRYGNFVSFTPTITVNYNNTNFTRSIRIEEPFECGDWLLTRNEVCEVVWQQNVPNGQECQNIWWVCTLVTRWISNTACIQTLDGTEVCSNEVIVNINEPGCRTIEVTKTSSNSSSVNATCFGQYTSAYTPISINCGNWNIFTGFAGSLGQLQHVCTYSSTEQADAAIVSCDVWNDTNNPSCTRWIASCELDVSTRVAILDEWRSYVTVQCSTNNNQEAALQIDCGNNTSSNVVNWRIMEHRCAYTTSDMTNLVNKTINISCEVNWVNSCDEDIILDEWLFGVCGDGVRQWYEQCDLGINNSIIGNYLDTTTRYLAPDYAKWKTCINCAIEGSETMQCLSVHNWNISIEKWEYLPAWWRVHPESFTTTSDCSSSNDKNKVIASSMKCTFELQKPGWNRKTLRTMDCVSNPDDRIFNYFIDNYINEGTNPWMYAFDRWTFNDWVDDDLWEYKIRLNEITYDYCDSEWQRRSSITDNVCESNFTITKPYLVQKSAFGTNPKATNIDLGDFYDINWSRLINRTDLADVMILDANDYRSTNINTIVDDFVSRMDRLAVPTSIPAWLAWQWVTAKKVPNRDIYVLEWGDYITLKKDASVTRPFTLIVKDATLIIDWNIDVNWMFIVQNWNIRFDDTSCDGPQTVKWIFVTKESFSAIKNINDNLNEEWCNAWWLHVKWVLIGGWIENLVTNKRSNLSKWFNVSWSESSIRIQRRNMIFNWASVLIEYSPELWQQLPPGADEFTETLEVYKK